MKGNPTNVHTVIAVHLLTFKPTHTHTHMHTHSSKPYRRIKLMVIGDGNKGKTSLLLNLTKKGRISRFKEIEMSYNNVPLATVGVDLGDWEYAPRNKNKITFMTWDFGGQEEYYATHQCFLTKRSLYLLVWNCLLYTSPSPRDATLSRMPSSA